MVNRVGLFVGIICLAIAPLAWADAALDAALALIPDGGDVAIHYDDAGRAALESAIGALEDAVGVTASFDAMSEDAYMALNIPVEQKNLVNKLSQAYYTLGDVFLHGQDGAKTAFDKGQLWGLKSLRMGPMFAQIETSADKFIDAVKQETDVAALYWTYGNWARKDEFDVLGAVFRNDPPKLQALIERALEIDPAYVSYGAYRSLAAFWGSLPSLPLITYRQDLPRALSYLCPVITEPATCVECAACPFDPDCNLYFENRLIFAQYDLRKKSEGSEAARVLESILDEPAGELHPLYNAFDQVLARELLADVQKHL
ncbi:MAG: TRAP transporter TatT component family protein [Candidatus Bipolaricaulota bacterium]|nr:TRAP transporter TatT component family protein [Candidatus Bipolaricaulota bacterium]